MFIVQEQTERDELQGTGALALYRHCCSTKLGQVMRLRTLKKTLHSLLHCSLALATAQTHNGIAASRDGYHGQELS